MKFFYQSGAMGFGDGYFWHKMVDPFPEYPIVTKTFTMQKKIGKPWAIGFIPYLVKSTWNKVSLHNPGLENYYEEYDNCFKDIIVSIHGYDDELDLMCTMLEDSDIKGIELNFSCPNTTNKYNKRIPETDHPLYLKLNYKQNPTHYDLDKIERIHLNSIPTEYGGISGKYAQQYNWDYIQKWNKEIDTPIAGCSWTSIPEIEQLRRMGCEYVGIGSQMLTVPDVVRQIPEYWEAIKRNEEDEKNE